MITGIHTADLHLGLRQYGFEQRELDFYLSASNVFKLGIANHVNFIILAGDSFDATKPSAEAVLVMQTAVAEAKNNGIIVVGVDGNHDSSEDNWLKVCGITPLNGKVIEVKVGAEVLRIAGINATRPSALYKAINDLQAPVHILVIHQSVSEMCDFAAQDFSAKEIAAAVKPLGMQYVAMGDIHTYRETVFDGVRFAYSGSTEVNAVDETTAKSVSLISFENGKVHTGIAPIETRPFISYQLADEQDLDRIAVAANKSTKPFFVCWYNSDKRELAKRAEVIMRSAGCMYRMMAYSGTDSAAVKNTFDRASAILQLKDAVVAYFDDKSDEYQLVFRLLSAPDNVKGIIDSYLKEKGL